MAVEPCFFLGLVIHPFLMSETPSPARTLSINPADHQVHEMYKLMVGLIVPRPVALVSTVDRDGVPNVAPFSFFSGVGSNPPTVLFCPSLRASGDHRKDTLRNVEQTGEFVINVVSDAIAAKLQRHGGRGRPRSR